MEQEIRQNAEKMAELLQKDFDLIIKKQKDDTIKILYYKPKNLLKGETK